MNRNHPALRYKTSHLGTGQMLLPVKSMPCCVKNCAVFNPAAFFRLFMSRPEGCKQTGRREKSEFAQLRKYIRCTMKVQHCKSHPALVKCRLRESGCISVRSCRSAAAAEHLAPRARPGPLDHVQYQEPWPEAALPRCAGVMVVPSSRRPASRCRGTLRPPAGAQLHLHTCVKGFRADRQTGRLSLCRIF